MILFDFAKLVQREWTVRATSLCDVKTLRREDVTLVPPAQWFLEARDMWSPVARC